MCVKYREKHLEHERGRIGASPFGTFTNYEYSEGIIVIIFLAYNPVKI